eukprot:5009506-Amphidinium_carterae.1
MSTCSILHLGRRCFRPSNNYRHRVRVHFHPPVNRCSGFGGATNTPPSQGGSVPGSVPEPTAASARAAPGPSQPTT